MKPKRKGGVAIRIGIDGPAGAGKSSIAKALAQTLGFVHIDTGAMYRALTWLALERDIPLDNEEALTSLAQEADIRLQVSPTGEAQDVYCQGRRITEEIRGLAVSDAVSTVSAVAGVRQIMLDIQRNLAANQDVVMDGRDIGTVVLPDAECKIFLTASIEERALRRKKEREGTDQDRSLEEIMAEISQRDEADQNRASSPLRPAEDSVIVDTSALSFAESLDTIISIVQSLRTASGA